MCMYMYMFMYMYMYIHIYLRSHWQWSFKYTYIVKQNITCSYRFRNRTWLCEITINKPKNLIPHITDKLYQYKRDLNFKMSFCCHLSTIVSLINNHCISKHQGSRFFCATMSLTVNMQIVPHRKSIRRRIRYMSCVFQFSSEQGSQWWMMISTFEPNKAYFVIKSFCLTWYDGSSDETQLQDLTWKMAHSRYLAIGNVADEDLTRSHFYF